MGKPDYDLSINVMMVGGRRCGKTSVLASMKKCFEKAQRGTPLEIVCANEEMLDTINEKQQEMKQYFTLKGKNKVFVPAENESNDILNYPFSIGIKDKKSRIYVNFVDYPGEWLKTEKAKVMAELKKSRILLVAIDTPHLMEADGTYNEPHNRCWLVSELVKSAKFADASQGAGLILFVPLKCERYYNEGRMDEVNAKVQKAYEDMIDYIKQPGADGKKSRITMAVTPILTLGGAEFNRFDRDDKTGDIRINEKYGTPEKPIYWFPDMSKNEPEPQYCEQPLLYVLSYVLAQAKKEKDKNKKGNIADIVWDWVQVNWLNWPSADDYLHQMDAINQQVKSNGDGYSVLSKGILRL